MHHAGLTSAPRLEPLRERYSDLWTRESIEALREKLAETPAQFETERAGLSALVAAACRNHLEESAGEVTSELEGCERSSQFVWAGEKVAASEAEAHALIAGERDAARRREIAARWFDAARVCDDLRAARFESLAEAARALGYADPWALDEEATAASLSALATQARKFLEHTAGVHASHLARWAAREVPPLPPQALSYADALYFRRAHHLDAFFRADGALAAWRETAGELGVGRQGNVQIDDDARPGKSARTACFGVSPPGEVRLVVGDRSGCASYLKLFEEGGRALQLAWSSAETAARHPEFVHAPDEAARDGAGLLLASLLRDAAWAGERLSLRAADAGELARSVALLDMAEARRCCAGVQYARVLCDGMDARSEQLAGAYVNLYTEATNFSHDPATRLVEAGDALRRSATRLRAILLAASLGEHLRGRYGRRWHASRAAGDELIDIWNAASRYHAEELARLAWGGQLEFDLLEGELRAALDAD
jgi:hypothetical protein